MTWYPVETAPEDGKIILVACFNEKYPNDFWPQAASFRGYPKREWRDRYGHKVHFTHWTTIEQPQ